MTARLVTTRTRQVETKRGASSCLGLGRRELAAEDQAYLSRLVAARTGLAQPEADRRVNQILEKSRDLPLRLAEAA